MINKIFKRIHSNFSNLFRFLFFIRYIFGIFFVVTLIFLVLPKFLDHKKKIEIFKISLKKIYDLNLKDYDNIKYNIFPTPNFEISNAIFEGDDNSIIINTKKFSFYPKIENIYDFSKLKINKVNFYKSTIDLEINNIENLIDYFLKHNEKFSVNNLNLRLKKQKNTLIEFNKVNYSNSILKRNIIKGEIFNRKFKTNLRNNYKNIKFKLYNTGLVLDISLDEEQKTGTKSGSIKAKVLDSNLKFDFNLDKYKINIINFYFRNKNLSFKNDTLIKHNPFFDASADFIIKELDIKLLKNFDYSNIIKYEKFLKNLNVKNSFAFREKSFKKNLINKVNLKANLAYGRLEYNKDFLFANNKAFCSGDIGLFDEFPILNFSCSLLIKDRKEFLKKFSIKYKNKKEPLNLVTEGYINIYNNKINFEMLKIGDKDIFREEELTYFKNAFEEILFDEGLRNFLNKDKIKKLIIEIS